MIFFAFETPEKEDKFLTIYKTYSKTIYYTLKRFNFDPHTIEDLSQDVYLILSSHLNDMDLSNFKRTQNYIITITRNISVNYLEAKKRQPELTCDISINTTEQPNNTDAILDSLIMQEQIRSLIDEIKKLDKKYRIVMELKYLGHLSNSEIASALNIKNKTVEVQLYRAKQILRERMLSHVQQ